MNTLLDGVNTLLDTALHLKAKKIHGRTHRTKMGASNRNQMTIRAQFFSVGTIAIAAGLVFCAASLASWPLDVCPQWSLGSQEMSGIDAGFRRRTAKVFKDWHDAIAKGLRRSRALPKQRI